MPFSLKSSPERSLATVMQDGGDALGKNSEILTILNSHNLLSARCLQKNDEASIYRNAKNSEIFTVLQSHNQLSAGHLQKLQLFAVDNGQVAAFRLAIFQNFSLLRNSLRSSLQINILWKPGSPDLTLRERKVSSCISPLRGSLLQPFPLTRHIATNRIRDLTWNAKQLNMGAAGSLASLQCDSE